LGKLLKKVDKNIKNDYEDVESFYAQVSKNVKEARKNRNISQLEFAMNVGFNSVSFYCDCENNKNGKHFNLIHLVRISQFLDIDIKKLIY
jgi:transcriptional regulator with XRE-family HTH domain